MDVNEEVLSDSMIEEVTSIVGLLSDEELEEIGIEEDEVENPTEETFKKIQEYFKNKSQEN